MVKNYRRKRQKHWALVSEPTKAMNQAELQDHSSSDLSEKKSLSWQEKLDRQRAAVRRYRENNREKMRERSRERYKRNKAAINAATMARRRANPEKTKDQWEKWYSKNKGRRYNYMKEWRRSNPDKVKATSKRKYAKHRDKQLAYAARWRAANPEKLKSGQKRYFDNKLKTDVAFRIRHQLRSHIRIVLNKQGVIKSRKTIELLGCTSQFFKEFIEAQFTDGMNWDNRGTLWQMDHIIPLASFDLSQYEQQLKAFHYSNCRPLLKEKNREKSDTMPEPHQALLL